MLTPREILADREHREPPAGPWVMLQRWHDFLFAHWPIAPEELRRHVPEPFEIDLHEGRAYVGVIPFRMSGIRLRGLPAIPGASRFCELNVRTYVTFRGTPGVWFFSLDAESAVAVEVARRWFHLPYLRARMRLRRDGDVVDYASERTDRRAPAATFAGRYTARGPSCRADADPLTGFLLERYHLFTTDRRGRILRGDIHHRPWTIRDADATIERDTTTRALGLACDDAPPLSCVSDGMDVLLWPPRRC